MIVGVALIVLIYTLATFLSAILLFLVQPMFARMVLPLLGGSPAVWNTVMVFFQAALLAGYAYAHGSTQWLGARRQAALHLVVLVLPLLLLPLAVPANWRPPTESNPVPSLLALLALTVGLPFFVVSTTSPLLQRWLWATRHPSAKNPYFLYAASNAGSMLALLSYPLLMEPNLRLGQQSRVWAVGYGVFILLVALCAFMLWRAPQNAVEENIEPTEDVSTRITAMQRVRWIILSFVPSSLLLSVTQYLSTDIAAIPLLWVVPLAIYLGTFILLFGSRPFLSHDLVARATALLLLPLVIVIATRATQPIVLLVPLHLLSFFFIAMLCHGELSRTKPPAKNLTEFYLWMSLGGVLGGSFNALLAPVVFSSLVEYPLILSLVPLFLPFNAIWSGEKRTRVLDWILPAILAVLTMAIVVVLQAKVPPGPEQTAILFGLPAIACFAFSRRPLRYALGIAALFWAGSFYLAGQGRVIASHRSFFGVHRVTEDANAKYHLIMHGGILHGLQSVDVKKAREPLAYYYRGGPVGQIFTSFKGEYSKHNIAITGLGGGGLSAYAQKGQNWTFYEIDPVVEKIARDPKYFTYLRDCRANLKVILGDGRLKIAEAPEGAYDLIILDAFSSDAVPVHLLTREAMRIYLKKLASRGIMAFHISNLHLDLEPVVGLAARDAGLQALYQIHNAVPEPNDSVSRMSSNWMIMARHKEDFGPLANDKRWRAPGEKPGLRLWTDDYSSILSVFVLDSDEVAQ